MKFRVCLHARGAGGARGWVGPARPGFRASETSICTVTMTHLRVTLPGGWRIGVGVLLGHGGPHSFRRFLPGGRI